nr:MAG TPA: minor tail protein [Caudoviricetes sp.]
MSSLEASLKLRDQFTQVLNKINNGLQKAAGNMDTFKKKISGPATAFQSLGNAASAGINKLNSSIRSKMTTASNIVKSSTEKILSVFGNFGNRISSKLGLSGVTQKFSSTFSSVKASVSSAMSSAVAKVASGIAKMKATIIASGPAFKQFGSEIKASFDKINTSVSTVGNKLLNVAKVAAVAGTAALVGIGKKVYDIAGGFESQMSRVQAISGATGDSFTKLRDQAIDLGAKTAFSATESAKGMEDLASAGFSANEIMAAMPGMLNLAAVSGGDVALAAENSAAALRGFGLEASQAGHVSDVFARAAADTNAEVADMGEAMKYVAPVAHSMGLSIEEVAASVGILSDAGIKGSQAGTTLRGALARLAKPTAAMKDTMANLGLSFYDSNGNMKSLTDQVGMLQKAFKGLTPEQQQNALVTLYGQESLSGMMALVAAGPDKLNKLTKSLENSNGAAEEMAKTMQNNLKSKVEQLGGALESVAIRIGDRLFPLIAPQIEKLTTWIDQTFSKVNIDGFFDKLSKYGKALKGAFDDVKGPISDAFGAIGDSLAKMNGKFGSAKNVDKFKSVLTSVTGVIKGIASFAEKHSDGIAKLISSLPKLMAAFVGFKIGSGVLGTIATFGSGIAGAAKATGTLVSNLAKLGKAKPPKNPTVPTTNLPSVGGQGGAATNPFAPLLDTFNGFAKSAGKLAIVFGVIKLIEEAAQALQDINKKVPKDLSDLAPKMLNMGIALTAMGAFVKVASVVAGNNISGAITGLAVVAGISGNLMLAAEALKQINDKVPESIGDVAKKMGSIAVAIGGMGVLITAVGAFASTGLGTVAIIAGLISVAAIASEMIVVAEAMQQFNNKVPEDISGVKEKIDSVSKVIGYFTAANLGGVIDLFSNIFGTLNVGAVSSGLDKMQTLAEEINNFSSLDIKTDGVSGKIDAIRDVMQKFNDGTGIISKAAEALSNTLDSSIVNSATSALSAMNEMVVPINQLATVPVRSEEAIGKVDLIKKVLDKVGSSSVVEAVGTKLQAVDLGSAKQALNTMNELVIPINQLATVPVRSEEAIGKIDLAKEVIKKLGSSSLIEWIGSMIQGSQVGEALSSLRAMNEMVVPINQLATVPVNAEAANGKIDLIASVIERLSPTVFGVAKTISSDAIASASSALQSMIELVPKINQLASTEVQSLQAQTVIQGIKNVLNELAGLNGTSIAIAVSGFDMLSTSMTNVVSSGQILITSLSQINTSVSATVTTVQTAGSQIVSAMTQSMTQTRAVIVSGTIAMASAFTSGMAMSVSTVRSGNAQIVGAFSGLRVQLQSAGYYAMSGLAAGIAAGSGSAIAQAQSVANQVSSTIRSALKIHSPSRVMMAVGQFVGQGLANGIAATQNLVSKASNALAFSAVPNPVADISANGTVTSNVQLDDSEISRLQASASQQVVVNHKQVVPQVTIHVENNNGDPIDTEALLQEFEERIEEMIDADLS